MTTNGPSLIEWGVAVRSFAGQAESGDQYLVKPFPNGILVGVVDGLGHGPIAAAVAQTAVAALEGHAHGMDDALVLVVRYSGGLSQALS